MKTAEEIIKKRYPFYDPNIYGKDIMLDGDGVVELMDEAVKDRDKEIVDKIDEMMEVSRQQVRAELDADEDMDNENLIDHQGRIQALTELKQYILEQR